ncbi:sperm microtubule associated protein 2-like [Eurosta solidaginis]|uniref:sperm microtubule associated protein 2-like n=1 Tax=Eurosta solidaginis TaxID=178769 RepID=UPI003530F260
MAAFRSLFLNSQRFKNLTYPRERIDLRKPEWKLTTALKHYKPSKRIIQLAQPIVRGIGEAYSVSPERKPKLKLSYQPSQRILELANPPSKPPDNIDKRKYPYRITIKALRAKPTPRVLELAAPKEHDPIQRFDPWAIPRSALRAKASQRLEILSKPKRCYSQLY